jgi:hypothetical protein
MAAADAEVVRLLPCCHAAKQAQLVPILEKKTKVLIKEGEVWLKLLMPS